MRETLGAEAAIKAHMTAGKLGITLPLVCTGLATWESARIWEPDGVVSLLEIGIAVAAVSLFGGGVAIGRVALGRTPTWVAYVWFVLALFGLLFLDAATLVAVRYQG